MINWELCFDQRKHQKVPIFRAGRASLECFRVSRLCAFFKRRRVSRLRARFPEKNFEHSWFRVIAYRACIFTLRCFRAPAVPFGLCPSWLSKYSKFGRGGGTGHTVTITSQNQNYANISGTTGPILLIFLVQNPYKFTKLLWKKIVHRYSHCWDY